MAGCVDSRKGGGQGISAPVEVDDRVNGQAAIFVFFRELPDQSGSHERDKAGERNEETSSVWPDLADVRQDA